jgi:hypothetical protein
MFKPSKVSKKFLRNGFFKLTFYLPHTSQFTTSKVGVHWPYHSHFFQNDSKEKEK